MNAPDSAIPEGSPESAAGSDDVKLLHSMGYAQELLRRMSGFSNFAISFSIICILAGGITSLQLGTSAVGGAAAGIIWPLGVGLCLIVTLAMAQISSAFPTAGGLYHWSSILGGKGWGWATAWFNLAGLVFVTASVNVGAYQLATSALGPLVGIDPSKLTLVHQVVGVTLITLSHALLNHYGIKVTTLLTDFSGYLIFAVAAILTIAMLVVAPTHDFTRLAHFTNVSGAAGGDTWPARSSLAMLLLALMWPIYTITGFDASAHTSEETVNAARNVPKSMIRSVYLSGIFGWVMVAAFVLAFPDMTEAAKQGGNVFPWLMGRVLPGAFGNVLWIGIVVANYLCGLACVTSTSRMIYAFSRDGGMPASGFLRRISPKRKVPSAAVWTAAVLTILSTLYTPAYTTLTAACVMFLYISYVMPSAAGFFRIGREWTRMGPFNLGAAVFKTLTAISVAFVAVLLWIGVQPPNDVALYSLGGAVVILPLAWCLGVRRSFKGPPVTSLAAAPSAEGAPVAPPMLAGLSPQED